MHECTWDENAVLGFNSSRERASADLRWAVARVQLTRKRTGSVFLWEHPKAFPFAQVFEVVRNVLVPHNVEVSGRRSAKRGGNHKRSLWRSA